VRSTPTLRPLVTPANGPTNKADCLNWVYQESCFLKKRTTCGSRSSCFTDAEDVVHPLSRLKYFNHLIPRVHFVQLPVFPLDIGWTNFIVGHTWNEFAENHTKDLGPGEILTSCLPCAGVGAAVSHQALDFLAQKHNKPSLALFGLLT